MQSKLPRGTAWVAALAVGTLILPSLAHAQMGMPGGAGRSFLGQGATPPANKAAPPPALPGAASRGGSPAPAAQTPSDMSPNDALFDAINRGDLAAARDALSRGAQLDAHNTLDMTPMELAVDLGRNDIAFLLLSMRSPGTGTAAPAGPAAGAARPAAAGSPPVAAGPAKPASRRMVVAAKESAPVTPPAPPEHARLFAHDGGAPIPGIGFLGFDPPRGAP